MVWRCEKILRASTGEKTECIKFLEPLVLPKINFL